MSEVRVVFMTEIHVFATFMKSLSFSFLPFILSVCLSVSLSFSLKHVCRLPWFVNTPPPTISFSLSLFVCRVLFIRFLTLLHSLSPSLSLSSADIFLSLSAHEQRNKFCVKILREPTNPHHTTVMRTLRPHTDKLPHPDVCRIPVVSARPTGLRAVSVSAAVNQRRVSTFPLLFLSLGAFTVTLDTLLR